MNIENSKSKFLFIGNTIRKFTINNNIINFHNPYDYDKTFDVEYKIDRIYEKEGDWTGILRLFISVCAQHKEEEEKNAMLHLVTEGYFSSNKQQTEKEEFEKMLALNGCATLYSISRAIIMTTSSQTFNFGDIVLPMVNVIKLKEEIQNNN